MSINTLSQAEVISRLKPAENYTFPPVGIPDHEQGKLYTAYFGKGELPFASLLDADEEAVGFYYIFVEEGVNILEWDVDDITLEFIGPFDSEQEAIKDFEQGRY